MPNDEYRIGHDGKIYPRLWVRQMPVPVPNRWRVEQVYAPGPFGTRHPLWEGEDAATAFEVAGEILDSKRPPKLTAIIRTRPAPTPEEIYKA